MRALIATALAVALVGCGRRDEPPETPAQPPQAAVRETTAVPVVTREDAPDAPAPEKPVIPRVPSEIVEPARPAYTGPKYFRVDETGKAGVSEFECEWYSKHLNSMKEPVLLGVASDKAAEVYRFTYLPTWGSPVAVRLTGGKDGVTISYRRSDGDGGYEAGKLVASRAVKLSDGAVEEFRRLFDAFEFYRQPSGEEDTGLDGSQWILEAVRGGRHHAIVRWTPDHYQSRGNNIAFLRVCKWLIDHAPGKGEPADRD